MHPSEPPHPAFWLMLQLPRSENDLTTRLATLLHELRIPAAVRHSMLMADGTFAMIPSDGAGSVLTVPDSYASGIAWTPVEVATVATAVERAFGVGGLLGGRPLFGDDDVQHPDGETTVVDAPPAIDTIAWTTREEPDLLSMLGSRLDMSFDAVDVGAWGRAVRPHLPEDRARAFDRGLWTMTDGIAFWRSGNEYVAAFMQRKQPFVFSWGNPWIYVDPSKPGQLVDGTTVRALLEASGTVDDHAAAWIARFSLDPTRASRLRALFRRETHPRVLDELFEILDVPVRCLDLREDDAGAGVDVIHPRSAREQFRYGLPLDTAEAAHFDSFRHRRPRLWLTVSLCCIVALATYAIAGVTTGRPTAMFPGAVALVWTVSLFLDGAFARARGVGREAPPPADSEL